MSNDNTAAMLPIVIGIMVLVVAGVFFAIGATTYYFIMRLRWTYRYSGIGDLIVLIGGVGWLAAQQLPKAFEFMGDDPIFSIICILLINVPTAFFHLSDTIFPPSKRKIEWIDMSHLAYEQGQYTAQQRDENIKLAKRMSNKEFEKFVYELNNPAPEPVQEAASTVDEFAGETAEEAGYFAIDETHALKSDERFSTVKLQEQYENSKDAVFDKTLSLEQCELARQFVIMADAGKINGIKGRS